MVIDYPTARLMLILFGWPILIAGTIYLFVKGRYIVNAVAGSMVGKIVEISMLGMIFETYCLGVACTAFLYADPVEAMYYSVPIFIIWLPLFIWTIVVIAKTAEDVRLTMGAPD